MTNVYQGGRQNLHDVPVGSSTGIKIGDLCWLDTSTGQVKPANAFTWTTDLATTQAAFAAKILGVATTEHIAGDATVATVTVDTSPEGLWLVGCVQDTFKVGDMLAPAKDGSNNALSNIVMTKTATVACAVARAQNFVASAAASVKVHYASAFDCGSNNKNAAIGA